CLVPNDIDAFIQRHPSLNSFCMDGPLWPEVKNTRNLDKIGPCSLRQETEWKNKWKARGVDVVLPTNTPLLIPADYDAKDIESRLPWLKRPRQELDVLPWVKRLYELKAWDFSDHLPLIQGFARAWGNRYVVQSGYGFEIG